MPIYFCSHCGKETIFLNISAAATVAQVTRTTIYAWIKRHRVHCVHRPSGRKFVCSDSLVVGEEYVEALPRRASVADSSSVQAP